MPLPGLLKGLIEGGLKGLGSTAKDIISAVGDNKMNASEASLAIEKEINRASEAIMSDVTRQMELENADRDSARDMNSKIQESEKASWLSKNTAYILDFIFVFAFLYMMYLIFEKIVPESNKEIFYMAFGSLGTIVVTIVSFHRGTSKGSEDKQKSLDRITRKI